jgi:tetratricopeptide (TPR) repeat protein
MIPIFRQEVDSMKNSTILAVMMCLLGCVPVRLTARGIQPNPAVIDLRTALDLGRRGGYREALEKYQAFLSNATVNLDPQLHAYVLQQIADADNGLGDYAQGEEKARAVLRLLADANERNTSLFATVYALSMEMLGCEKIKAYREAEALIPETLEMGVSQLGPNHPDRVMLLNIAASVYVAQRSVSRSAALFAQASHFS